MNPSTTSSHTVNSILAIHVGDAYIRAAFLDPVNQPTIVEDGSELQKFATPSLVTLDKGGALLGYPALMAASLNTPSPLVWRYARADLCNGAISLRDARGRGLTAMGFTALAVRRMIRESTAWSATRPHVVLVVPDALAPLARLNLATIAAEAADVPVALVGEAQALVSGLALAQSDRLSLVASFDDDALQLRLIKNRGSEVEVVATQSFAECGLLALRLAWFERWNRDTAPLLSGAAAFDSYHSVEFEKIWQDIWQCLDTDPRFKPAMPTWAVVRKSMVVPLAFSRSAAEAEVRSFLHGVGACIERILTATVYPSHMLSNVVVVGPTAIGRMLAPVLSKQLGCAQEQVRTVPSDVYAQGAALHYTRTRELGYVLLPHAPCELGALGAAKDDAGLTLKTLIAAGTSLPASASFSVMVNRDVQRHLVIKLASRVSGAPAELRYQAEFGPLSGQGMLKIKINVTWTTDARLAVTAVDTESEQVVPLMDAYDMVPAGPIIGVADILRLD